MKFLLKIGIKKKDTGWNYIFGKENLLLLFLLLMTLSACSSQKIVSTDPIEPARVVTKPNIVFYPGDEIEIKFAYASEFNETQTIRTDGKIELLLVGEIVVEGKSPAQLRNNLIELYSQHLSHPELSVIVRSSYRNRVFVGGAVKTPGVLDLVGNIGVLEAITEAGGVDLDSAKTNDVLLIRTVGGIRSVYTINLKSILSGKTRDPVYLQAMDVIYVPRTKIANAAIYAEQIWSIVPFRFNASYVFRNEDIADIFD